MENNIVEYRNFKLGKATEIIAKITMAISIIMFILSFILSLNPFAIVGLIFWIFISIKLFKPIIKLHENTILFTSHEITKDVYKKKRIYSLIASIIVGFFFGFVFGVSLGVIGVLLAVIMVLPYWIFLSKTSDLLSQEQEITIENKVEENEKKLADDLLAINTKLKEAQNLSDIGAKINYASELIDTCIPKLINIKNTLGAKDCFYLKTSDSVAANAISILGSAIYDAQHSKQFSYEFVDVVYEKMMLVQSLDMSCELKQQFQANIEILDDWKQKIISAFENLK